MMQKKNKISVESVISQRSYFIPSLTTFSILIKIILKSREHMLFFFWLYQMIHFSLNTKVTGTKVLYHCLTLV